jgi:hypothetical protein
MRPLKYSFLLLFCACAAQAASFYDCATGNSNASSSWSATLGGGCGAGVPGSADTIFIASHTITVNANLTVALATISGSGKLAIGSGVTFHSVGDITLTPTDQTVLCQISGIGGSTFQFDTRIHGTASYVYSPLCFLGSAGSHATIVGGSGGIVLDVQGGGITLLYTDVSGMGNASNPLTTIWTNGYYTTGNDLRLTHDTFTNCGMIGNVGAGSTPDGQNWIEQNNVWSGTLAATTSYLVLNPTFTSGTRSIVGNVYDKPFGGPTSGSTGNINGATVTGNFFGGQFNAGGVAATWSGNLTRASTEDGSSTSNFPLVGSSSFQNSYIVLDNATAVHMWGINILGATSSNITISGNILDSTAVSNLVPGIGNDGLVNDSSTGGQTITFSRNISLMGADGYGIASLVDTISSLSNITNIDHNTGIPGPWGAVEYELEAPPSPVGNRGTITNNLILDPANASSPVNPFILQSHCPPTTNIITDAWAPTGIHHNGIYGLLLTTTGTCASVFSNQANGALGPWSVTPNAVGLVQANPNLVDYTRSLALFDSKYMGYTYATWTPSTVYAKGACVSYEQAGYYAPNAVNYCATQNLAGTEANSTPGTGTSSRQYWEFATLTHIRAATASGATVTDSTLGLTSATYIQALVAWVSAGFAPQNVAFHNTASDGSDIGAVPYVSGAAVPVVSAVQVDDYNFNGGHSCVRLTWNSDTADGLSGGQQVLWGSTTSYGSSMFVYSPTTVVTAQQVEVCGLTSGATIHMCPQTHNSAGWSSCTGLDQTVTMPAAPTGPVTPAAPITAAVSYPNTSGFHSYTLASNCSDWVSAWSYATSHTGSYPGYIIYQPAGSTCVGNNAQYSSFPIQFNEGFGGVQQVSVNTSGLLYTAPAGGGFANGTQIAFSNYQQINPAVTNGQIACPATNPATICSATSGINGLPSVYYVVNASGTQFDVAATLGGTRITPSFYGYGSIWAYPTTPLTTAPIIYRSSAADSALPPPGVRLDPVLYANSIATLQGYCANGAATCGGATVQVFPGAHNLWIGPGIEITAAPYFANQTNQFDNPVQQYLWYQYFDQGFFNTIFDRAYIHGQPCPDRTRVGLGLDGVNNQVDSSVLDNMQVCRPNYSGLAVTDTSSTLSIASGTYYFLAATSTVGAATLTGLTGSASGTVWVTLPPGSSTPKVYVPSGMTGTCTGCTVVVSTLTDFPRDGNGVLGAQSRLTEGPIASAPLTSGALGAVSMALDEYGDAPYVTFVFDTPSGGNGEGGSAIDTVFGPGKQRVTNNLFHNDIGVAYFIEDTGAALGYTLSDFLTQRNSFLIDDVWSPSNAASNHLNNCSRNIYEAKTGARETVTGNIFAGQFGWCTPQAMAMLLASNNAQYSIIAPPSSSMSDLTATYNTIYDSSGGITVTGTSPGAPMPHPARRVLVQNNLLYNINAYQHSSTGQGLRYLTPGWCFYLGYGGEDWTVDHNTCYAIGGYAASGLQTEGNKLGGVAITNNIFNVGQDGGHNIFFTDGITVKGAPTQSVPGCESASGYSMLTCIFTPTFTLAGNVLVAGYTNTQAGTGDGDGTMGGAFSSAPASNTVRTESTVAARVAAIGFRNSAIANFRLTATSNYAGTAHPGTDGLPAGADLDAIDQHQGKILNLRALGISSSGVTLDFDSPDAGASCYIKTIAGTGTNLTGAVTTAADTTANRLRSITVTGLSTATVYKSVAMCANASNTPSVTFSTR